MAQTSIVALRRCLPLWRSRDPQLIKGRWLVDGGIDYFKGDADVNVSVVTQNFLMVKMAGRSFGRKKLQSDCHCVVWALVFHASASSCNEPRSSHVTWLWWGPDESAGVPLAFENSFSWKSQHDDGRAARSILVAIKQVPLPPPPKNVGWQTHCYNHRENSFPNLYLDST